MCGCGLLLSSETLRRVSTGTSMELGHMQWKTCTTGLNDGETAMNDELTASPPQEGAGGWLGRQDLRAIVQELTWETKEEEVLDGIEGWAGSCL